MIYQEINLPIWAQLVLMVVLIIALLLLAHIKPLEDVKEENDKISDNHVEERYGAYIQSQGRYYN
ncbi:hypothetical protein JavanS201_0007 [Streptococcus satellite phage Javan201]|uniref:hypothetical protein n=1 Tax=Streptococcus equinus TaxID=1335 RepID=UPI00088A3A65|nr:hypothetical protein [Streptococcus equinus]QBX07918.1 hypothetical protein JavanS201_0007 [Streptococcus satellite phage Javan201]QBX07934.1 hypothetical protein JavanS203_0007 [Streptococcus satellite phage Javan203]SDQ06580.1 hypothetical protein SAMN04488495_0110 [Streptococcus equinus]SEN49368.1 hypothetical protein SAMN04488496_0111 [Streptococcus equinus]